MTVLYVYNNAGGAVGIQLGNLDLSVNILQQSKLKKKMCMWTECMHACMFCGISVFVWVAAWLAVLIDTSHKSVHLYSAMFF